MLNLLLSGNLEPALKPFCTDNQELCFDLLIISISYKMKKCEISLLSGIPL